LSQHAKETWHISCNRQQFNVEALLNRFIATTLKKGEYKVSNAGNGVYAVISSEAHADKYVEDRMLATINHIAKDMKIQVEFNPEKVLAYRLLGYENRAIADEDFRNDTVDAGEVGEGHSVTALYELVMAGDAIPAAEQAPPIEDGDPVSGDREIDAEDLVLVKVRYKEVGAQESDPAKEVTQSMVEDEIALSHQEANKDLQWAAAVAAFAEILKESPYANRDVLKTIQGIVTTENWLDGDRQEFKQLFEAAQNLLLDE
jgi:Ca-activated chloride channel family protein